MNDNNWLTNYLYIINYEQYIININNEIFYKNVDDIDQQNEIQAKYADTKNKIVSIFEDDKQKMQVEGWNDIGSFKTIFITLLYNDEQQKDDLLLSEFYCVIFKDGRFSIYIEYEIDSVIYTEYIELLGDEEHLRNYKN